MVHPMQICADVDALQLQCLVLSQVVCEDMASIEQPVLASAAATGSQCII